MIEPAFVRRGHEVLILILILLTIVFLIVIFILIPLFVGSPLLIHREARPAGGPRRDFSRLGSTLRNTNGRISLRTGRRSVVR
jgi:hypothetical protein